MWFFCSLVSWSDASVSMLFYWQTLNPPFFSAMAFLDDLKLHFPHFVKFLKWFHSCQPSHGTKYLWTNHHWNSLFQVLTRLKQALFFFCPSEGVITPEIFVCDNVSTKLTNLPFPCWRNIHRLDCLCCSGINAVKDSQMKPETPNASDTSPHSWSKMQIETF